MIKFDLSINTPSTWLRVACLALGAFQAWAYRFDLNMDDSISYLEIAQFYLSQNWPMAINSYWSPLYSWLLAFFLWLLHPSAGNYLVTFKIVNFFSLLAALAAFEQLLKEFLLQLPDHLKAQARLFEGLAYLMFLLVSLSIGSVWRDTPDLLSTAFIYGATACLLRLKREALAKNAVTLGFLLGLGYLCKAVIFALSPVFLLLATLATGKLNWRKPLLALVCLLTISLPFIGLLSQKEGKFVINQAGALNYGWFVARCLPYSHAHFEPGPNQIHPWKHPSEVLTENPQCFYFGQVFKTTLSSHFDPTYYFDGFQLRFNLTNQLWATFASILFYGKLFFFPLTLAWLVQIAISFKLGLSKKSLLEQYLMLAPAIAGLSLYALVMNMNTPFTSRYLSSFLLLFYMGLLAALELKNSKRNQLAIIVSAAVLFGQLALPLAEDMKLCWQNCSSSNTNQAFQKALWLQEQGLKADEEIVTVGPARKVGWAQLAHLRIVGDIPDKEIYFARQEAVTKELKARLLAKHVKALVCPKATASLDESLGWKKMKDHDFAVLLLK